jgi:putative endonuclease
MDESLMERRRVRDEGPWVVNRFCKGKIPHLLAFVVYNKIMFYVYIIKSLKNDSLYIGYHDDLKKRIMQHNSGQSSYTKKYLPWELVYYEAYLSKKDALIREGRLKQFAKGYAQLKRRIKNSLDYKKPKGVG